MTISYKKPILAQPLLHTIVPLFYSNLVKDSVALLLMHLILKFKLCYLFKWKQVCFNAQQSLHSRNYTVTVNICCTMNL